MNYKNLRNGDFLIVYRKKGPSEVGRAGFKSVVTGVASVINIKVVDKTQEILKLLKKILKIKLL